MAETVEFRSNGTIASGRIVGTIRTGGVYPTSAAMTPDGKTVFITSSAGGTVTQVDAETLAVTYISAGEGAGMVVVRPESRPDVDQTPPTLSLPDDVMADAVNGLDAVIGFTVSAEDGDQPVPVECSPPSGSVFLIGTSPLCPATTSVKEQHMVTTRQYPGPTGFVFQCNGCDSKLAVSLILLAQRRSLKCYQCGSILSVPNGAALVARAREAQTALQALHEEMDECPVYTECQLSQVGW